jgi:hypothetical protein
VPELVPGLVAGLVVGHQLRRAPHLTVLAVVAPRPRPDLVFEKRRVYNLTLVLQEDLPVQVVFLLGCNKLRASMDSDSDSRRNLVEFPLSFGVD